MTRLTDAELAELLAGITQDPWTSGPCCPEHTPDSGWPWLSVRGPERGGAGGGQFVPGDAHAIARVPDLLADLIAAREALRGMTAIFEQMLAHPDDTMYDARFWKQIAREGIAKGVLE